MKKNAPSGKELLLAIALVCWLIAAVSFIAVLHGNRVIAQRQAEGVQTRATVVNKSRVIDSNGYRGTWVNALTVLFFTEATYEDEVHDLGEGFEITLPKLIDLGDLHRVEIRRVPNHVYDTIEKEEEVGIVYLASDPERAWLAEEVTDVQKWNGMGFVWGALAVGLVLFGVSRRRTERPFKSGAKI